MSMEKITSALKSRIRDFMMAKAIVSTAVPANTDPATVTVDDASKFNICHIVRNYPQALIFTKYEAGQKPIAFVRIKSVDVDANTITFTEPVPVDIPINACIKMAPNWKELQAVRLGDPTVIKSYPVICIEPESKANSYIALPGGMNESMTFTFFVHVLDDNSEEAVLTLIRLTEDLEDLLNGDLHIKAQMDRTDQYNRPYQSMTTNATYGRSNKGAFLRSSSITWTADMFWLKFIAAHYPASDPFE